MRVAVEELRLFPNDDGGGRDPVGGSKSRRSTKLVDYETAVHVFDHYVFTFWTGKGVRPVLSDKRWRIISRAIHDYGVDAVKQAITGCSLSPWHMGQNPSGKRYTDIELILRDSQKIEKFIGLVVAEDTKGGFLD